MLPTTTILPTTTVDPITAASLFLDAVAPLNCSGQFLDSPDGRAYGPDGLVDEDDWPAMQSKLLPAHATFANDEIRFMEALPYQWPAEVQADVDAVVADAWASANFQAALGAATSFEDFFAIPDVPQGTASTILRARLGLPSNVNTQVDFCAGLFPPASSVPWRRSDHTVITNA